MQVRCAPPASKNFSARGVGSASCRHNFLGTYIALTCIAGGFFNIAMIPQAQHPHSITTTTATTATTTTTPNLVTGA